MDDELLKNKKKFLDWLYNLPGNNKRDFDLGGLFKDSNGKSQSSMKWIKYTQFCLEIQKNISLLKKVNCRQVLPIEIALDLDEQTAIDDIDNILKKLEEYGFYYRCYKTGSKGYHIHLFFKNDVDKKTKEKFISYFGGDLSKKSKRNLIALEDWPHWKTGIIKTLYKSNEGVND